MLSKVSLREKFAAFDQVWSPKVVGELNGQVVKVAKLEGEFVWHQHADEDELFLVVRGEIEIHLRDGVVTLGEGEMLVIPRGVEHKPVARALAEILLFEPMGTRNTGEVTNELTVEPEAQERI